ncbi:MAG TPA: ABC transporter substrate-binding protein [Candidatus Nanopelagicaceae bacterium]|nr:ABC transporter substrate-binding protein [Candidatus Nanopelagicaceae bacterium]
MSSRMRRLTRKVAALAVMGLAISALPAQATTLRSETGVTNHEIKIGITIPMSGIAAPGYNKIAPAAQAYLDYVNAHGGVYGRKITLVVADDRYSPTMAVSQTNKLILQNKVFALAGALGTANHLAVLNSVRLGARGIPDLFVNTGYSGFDNPAKYPTTFTYLPSYIMEAKIIGSYLAKNYAGKKIGLIYQDDDFGRNAKTGFKTAGTNFVVTKGYASGSQSSPGLAAQVGAMQAAGADVVVMFGVTSATAVALITAGKMGYKPTKWIIGSVGGDSTTLKALGVPAAILAGATGASFLPSPTDTSDPYISFFKRINDTYNKGRDTTWDNNALVGMNMAMILVQALRAAGKHPTRKAVVRALIKKGKTFAQAGLVPLGYSKKSHAGYTGYWFGTYDMSGDLQPDGGKYTPYVTDSGSGPVTTSNYKRPALPANGLPTNK